jgi:GT2 family glycosyltransferase
MTGTKPRTSVGVVLLNWNGGEFTIPCIQSLLTGSIKPDKIVVVDNGSTDGSLDRIKDSFPRVAFIENKENRGFAEGNNQGIAYLLDDGMDYIWLLNNDTIVDHCCLEIILNVAKGYPDGAGFTGKTYYDESKDRLWYAGAFRHPWHLSVKHFDQPILDDQTRDGAARVPFISGCCMFVPAWAWKNYGQLLGDYIAYSEDNEWCWRVSKKGGGLFYVPSAILYHKLSASIKKNTNSTTSDITPLAWFLMTRNYFFTLRIHAEGLRKVMAMTVGVGLTARNVLIWAIGHRRQSAQAALRGMLAGLFKKPPVRI